MPSRQDERRQRWQDERIVGERREPMHTPLRAYESPEHAHASQVLCEQPTPSRWVLPLTPARWAFRLATSTLAAPPVHPATGFDTAGWGEVEVPASLEAPAVGQGQAQYTNVRYAFKLDPPHIPIEGNHVGCYQTTFELPKSQSFNVKVTGSMRRFCGLMSRWHTPRLWMCIKARASWYIYTRKCSKGMRERCLEYLQPEEEVLSKGMCG